MRKAIIGGILFFCVVSSPPANAYGAGEDQLMTPGYLARVGRDLVDLPMTVTRLTAGEWLAAGGFAGAAFAAYTVDGKVRRYFLHHDYAGLVRANGYLTWFGDWRGQVPLLGGAWLGGLLLGSPELSRIAADGVEASLIAAGIIGPTLTFVSGRELPRYMTPQYEFHPFHTGKISFPSGHTAEAFAVATVLDRSLRSRFGYWHTPFVYGIAAMLGAGRVRDQSHYLSDVLVGAGIGWGIGTWVSNR